MTEVADRLIKIFKQEIGNPYDRRQQRPIKLADNFNNQAVSLMELGKVQKAEKLWEEALEITPQHIEATFNLEVSRSRRGLLDDVTLLPRLQDICDSFNNYWLPKYLLALIQLERADIDSAIELLELAIRQAPSHLDLQPLLNYARSGNFPNADYLRTFQHSYDVTSVAFSPLPSKASQEYVWRPARLWSYSEWLIVQNKIKENRKGTKQKLSQKKWGDALEILDNTRELFAPYQTNTWFMSDLQQLYPFTRKIGLRGAWLVRTLQGHTDKITSVAFSPDGRFCLSGARDQTVKVWEVETGDCLYTLEGHENRVWSVAISPDGQFALSGSPDKTLKLWDIKRGRYLRTFSGHTSGVISVAFSASGRFCFSGSDDRTLKVWDVGTGYCLRTLQGHSNAVTSVTCSADDSYCLSGSDDYVLKVWEIKTGYCLQTLAGHTNSIQSAAFSPDGRYCCSGGRDKTLKVWDLEADNADNCLHTLTGHKSELRSVAFSPDGRFVLSGSSDGTLKVWDIESGHCLRTLKGHTNWVLSVAFSPDGKLALSGSWDKTLKLWALDWALEARELADWDEGARVYVENFLTRQTPYVGTLPQDREPTEEEIRLALTRRGKPTWTEEEFQRLIRELQGAGYGWLRQESIKAQLIRMAKRR